MLQATTIAKHVGLALMFFAFLLQPTAADAQDARVHIKVTKAGFVVGVTSGSGTLYHGGNAYPLSVSGLKVGFTIGVATAEFVGVVENLRQPEDIAGTYTSATGSVAIGGGVSSVVLQNEKGVRVTLRGRQAGIEASLDVGGITVRLK